MSSCQNVKLQLYLGDIVKILVLSVEKLFAIQKLTLIDNLSQWQL